MINFIDVEQKLIQTQLAVSNAMKEEEMLDKADSASEALQSHLAETVPVTLKTAELLSIDKKLELPLRVRGKFVGVGKHKRRYYKADELKKSVEAHGNSIIPIRLDHQREGASFVIGAVDRLIWDDENEVVLYEGHINDETHARNVLDTVSNEVSGGMNAVEAFDPMLGIVATDIDYIELSIVGKGSFGGNTIEAVL